MMGPRKQKASWESYLIYKVMQVFSYHKYLALMWNNVLWGFFSNYIHALSIKPGSFHFLNLCI